MSTGIHIQGDFEITVSYEILEEIESSEPGAKPTALQLIVNQDEPPNTRAVLARRAHAKGGTPFSTWSNSLPFKLHPAEAKSGRLRLVRIGGKLSYSVSEKGDAKFTELYEAPFNEEAVADVKLAGTTGGADATLDVRFTDLRIRGSVLSNANAIALEKPATPESSEPREEATPPTAPGRGWLAVFAIGGTSLIACFAAVLGVAILLRKRRTASPAAASGIVVFPCSECGKNLKVKSEMAGKKVRCSHCGENTSAPLPGGW